MSSQATSSQTIFRNNFDNGEEFVGRPVALHVVDLKGNPLDVVRIGSQFRESTRRLNVINRCIHTNDEQFVRIGASEILSDKLIAKQLPVAFRPQMTAGRTAKITRFTVLASRKFRSAKTVVTNSILYTLFRPGFSVLIGSLSAVDAASHPRPSGLGSTGDAEAERFMVKPQSLAISVGVLSVLRDCIILRGRPFPHYDLIGTVAPDLFTRATRRAKAAFARTVSVEFVSAFCGFTGCADFLYNLGSHWFSNLYLENVLVRPKRLYQQVLRSVSIIPQNPRIVNAGGVA